jgi:hypothetical protein
LAVNNRRPAFRRAAYLRGRSSRLRFGAPSISSNSSHIPPSRLPQTITWRSRKIASLIVTVFFLSCSTSCFPQSSSSTASPHFRRYPVQVSKLKAVPNGDFVHAAMQQQPWEKGVFFQGGLGTDGESSDHFLSAGVRLGKVLTDPTGPGLLRGQFEYAMELMPYWQAFTPKHSYEEFVENSPSLQNEEIGGTYTGLSITPIILRWDLIYWKRWMPWMQGAGGLVWTNHKFPPNGLNRTSVWNFTPQFGVGVHYFLKPGQSLTLAANAIHISNASLGDSNPGVNATVQFQIGYTWW